jgi:uncharacterized protein (DUF697 family)
MPNDETVPTEVLNSLELSQDEREVLEQETGELREFARDLTIEEIRSGTWFAKLIGMALDSYSVKVDWAYFQTLYEGVPVDVIVEQRIRMAARYAALEGAASASAYTAAIASTIGSLGGSSPLTVPAALTSVLVDIAYVTRLQLRLAYDISVLYGIPVDPSDPDDMWKLIRVALTIKSGELVRESATKAIPVLVRPLVKRYFAGTTLQAAKALPVVGKYLLQRNVIKVGIPGVGIPLATVLNRYTTQVAGKHAQAVFRNEARIIELVEKFSAQTADPSLTMWVAWYAVLADGHTSDDEALLLRHLARVIKERHGVVDDELARVIDFDPDDLWRRLDADGGDIEECIRLATRIAEVDGPMSAEELEAIQELRDHRPTVE